MSKFYYIKGIQFAVDGDNAQIQVGNNWGNRIETTIEKAREIWKAIRKGEIECHDRGLDTFITVNQIRDRLEAMK